MSFRTVSWTQIDRAGHDSRTKIPAGLLSARTLIQFGARTRPLATAGQYRPRRDHGRRLQCRHRHSGALRRLPR